MFTVLKILRKLYLAFAGSRDPRHLAFGFSLGLCMGLVPQGLTEPFTLVFVVLLLVTRAGIGMTLTSFGLTKLLVMALGTGWLEQLGFIVLERLTFLHRLWATVLDLPVIALFGLDRYVAMGGLVAGLVLSAALWLPFVRFVVWFRTRGAPRLERYRVVRWLKKFWVFRLLGLVAG
ncbi:MAG: hypothetical protein D6776_07155 [Planctomycetota bacterium]|nr:MAG: hypothetical protein D6776_07155 [Planctomycetota bacterium]